MCIIKSEVQLNWGGIYMPLNNSYDEQAVIQAIASALETFYGTLIEKIDGLNIQKVMKRKNPYLYRAKAMQSATEIVDSVLTAFVSSSEETIFGNCFFEPIAIAAIQTAKNVRSRTLQRPLSWRNRQKQDMKHILVIAMERRKIPAEGNRKCIRNWLENACGQN